MSFTFHGIPGSENIGIGRAHVVSRVLLKVDRYDIESSNLQFECDRLMSAIKKTQNDLSNLVGKLPANTPREFEAFLNLHKMILKDPTLSKETKKLIKELHCNAEWALKLQTERLWSRFDAVDDKYLRDKKKRYYASNRTSSKYLARETRPCWQKRSKGKNFSGSRSVSDRYYQS